MTPNNGSWSGGGNSRSFTFTASGTYSLVVQQTAGAPAVCAPIYIKAGQASLTIQQNSGAAIVAGNTIGFTVSGGSGTGGYSWSGVQTASGSTENVTFNTPGTYRIIAVRAADTNYLVATAFTTVNVLPTPVVSLVASTPRVMGGQGVQFAASGGTAGNYVWSVPSGWSSPTQGNAKEQLTAPVVLTATTYTITVTLPAVNGYAPNVAAIQVSVDPIVPAYTYPYQPQAEPASIDADNVSSSLLVTGYESWWFYPPNGSPPQPTMFYSLQTNLPTTNTSPSVNWYITQDANSLLTYGAPIATGGSGLPNLPNNNTPAPFAPAWFWYLNNPTQPTGSGSLVQASPSTYASQLQGGYLTYNSNNDALIYQFAAQAAQLGISILTPDMTNGVSNGIFNNPLDYATIENAASLQYDGIPPYNGPEGIPNNFSQPRAFAELLVDLDKMAANPSSNPYSTQWPPSNPTTLAPDLSVIPWLGAQDENGIYDMAVIPGDPNGMSPFQYELVFFLESILHHPTRFVHLSPYSGTGTVAMPVLSLFHAPGQNVQIYSTSSPGQIFDSNAQLNNLAITTYLGNAYAANPGSDLGRVFSTFYTHQSNGAYQPNFTVRHITGLLDAQSNFFSSTPAFPPYSQVTTKVNTYYVSGGNDALWSIQDNSYNCYDAFSSYTLIPGTTTSSVESLPAEMLGTNYTVGTTAFLPVRSGKQVNDYMSLAYLMGTATSNAQNPRFLFLNNSNVSVSVNGWTPFDRDSILPSLDDTTNGGLGRNYTFAQNAVASYGSFESGNGTPHFRDIGLRGQINAGPNALVFGFNYNATNPSYPAPQRLVIGATGPSLATYFSQLGLSTSGITFATNPTLALVGTLAQTTDYGADYTSYSFPPGTSYFSTNLPTGVEITNANWTQQSTATNLSGGQLTSPLGPRTFVNSTKYFTQLNYTGSAPTTAEPGITADLDPGSYQIAITDGAHPTPVLPGLMTHLRLTPGDLVSPNRIVNFWAQGYVSTGNNVLILGFKIDQPKAIMILGAGPGFANLGYTSTLGQPVVTLYNSAGTAIGSSSSASQKFKDHYGSWVSSSDAGLEETNLPAGSYTVILSGGSYTVGLGWLDISEDSYPNSSY